MKKQYECPELEIKRVVLSECILSSIESNVNSEIHDFEEPTGGIDDL